MANVNRPNGLTPVGYLNGADWDGRGRIYCIPAATTAVMAVGDPVALVAGADSSYGLPCIGIGSAGNPAVGVLLALSTNPRGLGPYVDPTALNTILHRTVAASTTDWYALVADDPHIVFEIQEAGTGTTFAVTAANKNCNFAIGTPAAPGWLSKTYADNGTAANTTATMNLKLLGLKQSIDNAPGQYQRWWCLLNNHVYSGGTGVLGV
jgi:hypothetical protein